MALGFRLVTDARDPSAGIPMRQPSDGMPSRQSGGVSSAPPFQADLPDRHPKARATGSFDAFGGGDLPARGQGVPARGEAQRDQGMQAFPVRQPTARPLRSSGRHRRAVPASLPQTAPALVLAVPGADTDLTSGPAGELTAILRVDNPSVEVRAARIDGGGAADPSDLRAVLADVATRRPDGPPCAVVIPLIATVNPPVIRRLRESVAASGVNALVSGFLNSNAMIAEALHIRLAEAGLARADRVRLFSIVTAADGVLIATSGGPNGAAAANVTSVLLAARLALPVITASVDSAPTVLEGVMRLKEMGVNRLAIAPCFIGPEVAKSDLDSLLALGADCAAPIGAHANIAKLAAMTYGQALSSLDVSSLGDQDRHGQHE
jgi:hypothetical protein